MERVKRAISLLLCFVMVVGLLPMHAFAATADDSLTKALAEAKSYIDGITVNNSSNDPETVVKNFKTHFTWDNEKRENSKSYLFDWSYYNGVVFEGIEYLYEVTGEEQYKDYVVEYMSSLIASNGTWAKCTNSGYTSKECAGYNSTHGADCYKTASLLLDAYEMTKDSRYLTMAATLYADLDSAASKYSLSNAGNNYRHTWSSDPNPDLWLDGLYMILPFRAEYAKYIGDTEELDLIVSRMQWVSDNMYNSSKGLFYHAADSATSNSGSYWLRAIGWYAAAIVDIMDSMEGENLEAMKAQLVKLVDGMKACQNSSNGMWLNNLNVAQSSTNPYETSGTALTCYAVMKAVNNGWLDESYADMAILAFKGICSEKLDGDTLTDICFKGAPNSSNTANSTFYDNEGKGVGPFIMLYAEVLEYYNRELVSISVNAPAKTEYEVGDELDLTGLTVTATNRGGKSFAVTGYTVSEVDMTTAGTKTVTVTYQGLNASFEIVVNEPATEAPTEPEITEPETTEPEVTEPEATEPVKEEVDVTIGEETFKVTVENVANVVADAVTEEDKAVVDAAGLENVLVFDMTADLAEGAKAIISIPVPEGWDQTRIKGISVEDGVLKLISGTVENGVFSYEVDHFSAKGITETDWVTIPGEDMTIFRLANSLSANKKYLIVSSDDAGNAYAVNLNGTNINSTAVKIVADAKGNYIEAPAANAQWLYISGYLQNVDNSNRYLRGRSSSSSGNVRTTNDYSDSYTSWTYSDYYGLRGGNGRYIGNEFDMISSGSTSDRVYIFVEEKVSTATTYARLSGELNQSYIVSNATELADVLSLVKIQTSTDRTTVSETLAVTAGTIAWNKTFDGETEGTYTATVTYEGEKLGSFTVTIQSRSVETINGLVGSPVTVIAGAEPDYSDVYLDVTYSDGEPGQIPHTSLDFSEIDTSMPGTKTVTVTYGDWTGNLIVNVIISYPDKEATSYPEYPADGAVRIDKTAKELDFEDTGVVQVELDVAGISMKRGVDVVLTIDISNSMAWKYGSTTDTMSDNKLLDVMKAIKNFATIFLADNEDGSENNNTITLVTFGGYDAENFSPKADMIDSTRILVSATDDISIINDICNNTKFLNGDGAANGYDSYDLQLAYYDSASNSVKTEHNGNRGDTNYDFAFWQTNQAVITGNLGAGSRDVYVLFMTDGCASNFNNIYYRTSTDALNPGTNVHCKGDTDYRGSSTSDGGKNWTDLILSSIKSNMGNIYARELYDNVNGIYAIGFDMAYGSFSGIYDWNADGIVWEDRFNEIVSKVVTDSNGNGLVPVTAASDTDTLNAFYSSLASELKLAGTAAQVTDTIGSEFTLQMGATSGAIIVDPETKLESGRVETLSNYGITPEITIKAYDLWTKAETSDFEKIGSRKVDENGNYIYTTLETVTFNDAGTEAYTSANGENNTVNIMTINDDKSVTIAAKYFTYTKSADGVETFNWIIGNITDKEITLSFMAYLKGSLEGQHPKGLVYTNEEATLEYIDINGDYAHKEFPVPAVAWGGASTAYEFYLVNEDGLPCDRNGNIVPFPNRIIITGPYFEELYLNQAGEYVSETIAAAYVLPTGYVLFDETAKYSVVTASGGASGKLNISLPYVIAEEGYTGTLYEQVTDAEGNISYVESASGTYKKIPQTTILVSAVTPSYIQSRIAFGVMYHTIPTTSEFALNPDKVVIDYGKDILIDITNSSDLLEDGYTATLIGFSKYFDTVDLKTKYSRTNAVDDFKTDFGIFSVEKDGSDGNHAIVRYSPTGMLNSIDQVFAVIKMYNPDKNDTYYMADWVTVIPATIVYYETDFADGVFKIETTGSTPWSTKSEGPAADGPQNDGTIGQNTYGFDSTYENDAYLSNGSSLFVEGAGVKATTAEFSFTGTGFDLISRTGAQQGFIRVSIYRDAARTELEKAITVLNKSETNLELYQIPVVSVNDLDYGTYYVTIGVNAAYNNESYPALSRGGEFYFDAIRIYDPAKGNATAEAAYSTDGEANNDLKEVRYLLISADTFNALTNSTNGVVFVDRTYTGGGIDLDVGNVGVTDYTTIGPNNEVYLSNGQAVAFKVRANTEPASFDIGAKSITGSTASLKVTVCNTSGTISWTVEKEIASSTVQFIDLLSADNAKASLLASDDAYVVITNTGDGVLSITDIKTAFSTAATAEVETASVQEANGISVASVMTTQVADPYAVSFTVDGNTLAVARSVLSPVSKPQQPQEPEVPEEPETPEEPEVDTSVYNILEASVKVNGSKKNQKFTITVVTSQEVEDIKIYQGTAELEPSKISFKDNKKDGTRTWTIVLTSGVSERYDSFSLVGIGDNDVQSESFSVKKPR